MAANQYYTIADLTRVLNADYKTICKAIEAGKIPYKVAPLTGKKLFERELIKQMFSNTLTTA